MRAIEKGNDDYLQLLIAAQANVNQKDKVCVCLCAFLRYWLLCITSGVRLSMYMVRIYEKGDIRKVGVPQRCLLLWIFTLSELGCSWVFRVVHILK